MSNSEVEIERTFLARKLPEQLTHVRPEKMVDVYLPEEADHPQLRIRRKGDKYEITKKVPLNSDDKSQQTETTIPLTEEEFTALLKSSNRTVEKNRYTFEYAGYTSEIDVFLGALNGLVLVDFEFKSEKEKNDFQLPGFCLADVTQEKFIAGGVLAGKSYSDIQSELHQFGYEPIIV